MKSTHVIGKNDSNHSASVVGPQTQAPARPAWPIAKPPPAKRPCRRQYRDHLRNIRSAELAFWEATGGDVLTSGAAKLFSIRSAGTARPESRW